MTTVARLAAESEESESQPASSAGADAEVAQFLRALSGVLRETVGRLEHTGGQISEMVAKHAVKPDRSLVVLLQEFDRLQQEFVTLEGILARIAATSEGLRADDALLSRNWRETVEAISLHDLKERFGSYLASASEPESQVLDEQEF